MVEHLQGLVVGNTDLGGLGHQAPRLHLPGQGAQLREQGTAFGQCKRRPGMCRTEALHIALMHQGTRLKQPAPALHLALQGLAHKAREQRRPARWNVSCRGLRHQQFEVVRRAQQVQLRRVLQVLPQRRAMLRAVEGKELFDLRVGQGLDAHLPDRTLSGRQQDAVIQRAAGEYHPVPWIGLFQFPRKSRHNCTGSVPAAGISFSASSKSVRRCSWRQVSSAGSSR
jgi:hypothetical protein